MICSDGSGQKHVNIDDTGVKQRPVVPMLEDYLRPVEQSEVHLKLNNET